MHNISAYQWIKKSPFLHGERAALAGINLAVGKKDSGLPSATGCQGRHSGWAVAAEATQWRCDQVVGSRH
jgi:hypothetical protein